jgi:hypothetical protein
MELIPKQHILTATGVNLLDAKRLNFSNYQIKLPQLASNCLTCRAQSTYRHEFPILCAERDSKPLMSLNRGHDIVSHIIQVRCRATPKTVKIVGVCRLDLLKNKLDPLYTYRLSACVSWLPETRKHVQYWKSDCFIKKIAF